ncbi:MAG: hypothetical protein AAB336_12525 [Acidobacteriota bacterium]
MRKTFLISMVAIASFALACNTSTTTTTTSTNTNTSADKANKVPGTQLTKDGYVTSESGTEKEKPESGKANVQGKAMFNEKPAPGVEAKLCEKFNTFMGCSGQQYTTKTDENGEYLFKNVEPKDYEGLIVRVFNTQSYVFAAQTLGISAAKYKIEAGKTFFAPPTNLFKSDLKAQNPKANAKVDAKTLEIKWDAYPEAAYYKFGLYPKEAKVTSPYINEKVEGNSFKIEKPMVNGEYRLKIDAYNANDIKLSQLNEDVKFNITGGEEMPAATNTNAAPANK